MDVPRAYRVAGTFAFSSSNQFWIRLMCVTAGGARQPMWLWTRVEPLPVGRDVVAAALERRRS